MHLTFLLTCAPGEVCEIGVYSFTMFMLRHIYIYILGVCMSAYICMRERERAICEGNFSIECGHTGGGAANEAAGGGAMPRAAMRDGCTIGAGSCSVVRAGSGWGSAEYHTSCSTNAQE